MSAVGCLAGALAWGCAGEELDQPQVHRPTIDAESDRCGPIEIVPIDHAEQIFDLPGGDLAIIGNDFDQFHGADGHIVRIDPTGTRPSSEVNTNRAIASVALLADSFLVTDFQGLQAHWDMQPLQLRRRLEPTRYDQVTALDAAVTPNQWLFVGGYTRLGFGSPRAPSVMAFDLTGEQPYSTSIFIRVRPDGRIIGSDGEITSLLHVPGEPELLPGQPPESENRVLIAGADAPPSEAPDRLGLLAVVEPRGYVNRKRYWPQVEMEPVRLLLDNQQRPWVAAVEGHTGDRYITAKPFLARVDMQTLDLLDIIRVPLPEEASQGGLLDALQLENGDWIVGGAACGDDRTWCQAWMARVDATGSVIWSRRATRDVAATVSKLHRVGDRVIATVSSSVYCCQWRELRQDGWLWALETDGSCPVESGLRRDGVILR